MRLIVTRPAAQAAEWVDALRGLGLAAQALPLIGIGRIDDPAPLRAAWQALPDMALAMFVSANAVAHFFAQAPAGAWPAGVRAACTGPGTAAALRAAAVPAACIVQPPLAAARFDSEALWELLAGEDWRGRRVLVVRGEDGRDWLADTLRARGATVAFVAAYRRLAPQPDAAQWQLLADAQAAPADWLWLFSSSEALAHLRALAPAADWTASRAAASHARIVRAARDAGFGQVLHAPMPSPAAVASLVARWPSIQSGAL